MQEKLSERAECLHSVICFIFFDSVSCAFPLLDPAVDGVSRSLSSVKRDLFAALHSINWTLLQGLYHSPAVHSAQRSVYVSVLENVI